MTIQQREKNFYDELWKKYPSDIKVEKRISIPEADGLSGKRVLVCAIGEGTDAVALALQGADVYGFDLSRTSVDKTSKLALFNHVSVTVQTMDFHNLKYQDDFFDIVYGHAILHHVDCEIAGKEIYRCLKPGGIAYFGENSDRNPILRWLRRMIFGKPGGYQKKRFLFFRRTGTEDEYPITEEELQTLSRIFKNNLRLYFPEFYFFQLFYFIGIRKPIVEKITRSMDKLTVFIFPFLRKYSFFQKIWMKKPFPGKKE